jgi:hypothetical protein
MGSTGVIYHAVGEQYINEALYSAESLKQKHPDTSISIFSDQDVNSENIDENVQTSSAATKKEHRIDRITRLMQSPYEKTLYLDSDTYIASDISHVFKMLERFDICGSIAPARIPDIGENEFETKVPPSFPMLNAGVLLYKSQQVIPTFERWKELYHQYIDGQSKDIHFGDQTSFREALYQSDIQIGILPAEYNCRFSYPGSIMGEVKIMHGRSLGDLSNISEIASEFNKDANRRDPLNDCLFFLGNAQGNGRMYN